MSLSLLYVWSCGNYKAISALRMKLQASCCFQYKSMDQESIASLWQITTQCLLT